MTTNVVRGNAPEIGAEVGHPTDSAEILKKKSAPLLVQSDPE